MKKSLISSGLASVLLVASASAEAIVLERDFSINNIFSVANYSIGFGTPTPAGGTVLAWGNVAPALQSSLVMGSNPVTGSVDTFVGGGAPPVFPYVGNSLSITHNNFAIPGDSATLTSATISSAVNLTPDESLAS
jgi:hypothetical protein